MSDYSQGSCSGSVHAPRATDLPSGKVEGRPCHLLACGRVFRPKRQDQRFCSAECRKAHFSLARTLGLRLIEAMKLREPWAIEAARHLAREEDSIDWGEHQERERGEILQPTRDVGAVDQGG
jgi:hypothetical protein